MDLQEALQELEYAPADIQEAETFADREQYVTAVGILTAVTRTLENVAKEHPQLDLKVVPLVTRAAELTMRIIREAQQ